MKLNKINEVWNSANSLFQLRFQFVVRNFAIIATWRNDFSLYLLTETVPNSALEQLI